MGISRKARGSKIGLSNHRVQENFVEDSRRELVFLHSNSRMRVEELASEMTTDHNPHSQSRKLNRLRASIYRVPQELIDHQIKEQPLHAPAACNRNACNQG